MERSAKIGIIGGSGFYSLMNQPYSVECRNKYGSTSAPLSFGKIENIDVAFLPRHGVKHTLSPHKVPFRANIEALAEAGVERVIATSAVGSLSKEYRPGDFVLFDQFVNMTHGRDDTFFDEDKVVHVSTADPYCSELRALAQETADEIGINCHSSGTVVVVNGPRFSTKAESRFFSSQSFQLINMTQYPEVALAREKALCYLGIGIVTDYDAGLQGNDDIMPVSTSEMLSVFGKSVENAKEMIRVLLSKIPDERGCSCSRALDGASISSE
jgi:5'-methylthioadenosine phosphorylase